jgi:hypothetical protein
LFFALPSRKGLRKEEEQKAFVESRSFLLFSLLLFPSFPLLFFSSGGGKGGGRSPAPGEGERFVLRFYSSFSHLHLFLGAQGY